MMVEAIKKALEDLEALVTIVAKDTGALVMSDPDEESVGSTLEGDLEMTFGHVRRAHAAVAALEAALSTDAEPVMFVSEQQLGCIGQYIPTRKEADGNFQLALYRAPPAPAVAVKALADAYQKYLDASALYNERLAIAKTKAPGTMRVDDERKAIDDARRAFDKLAVKVATTSVSAQVQDVTGWQLVPKVLTEDMKDAHFNKQRGRFVAPEAQEIWDAMLAASPASKHGDVE